MSNLICPFCQQELEEDIVYSGRVFVSCNNPKCPIMDWGGCSKQIVTELIRTRKALDRAKLILKNLLPNLDGYERLDVEKSINEITALEQKDVK